MRQVPSVSGVSRDQSGPLALHFATRRKRIEIQRVPLVMVRAVSSREERRSQGCGLRKRLLLAGNCQQPHGRGRSFTSNKREALIDEADPFSQLVEAWVSSKIVPSRVQTQPHQPVGAFVVCFVQPAEGFGLVAETGMDKGNAV
jgi:hypothetical protein